MRIKQGEPVKGRWCWVCCMGHEKSVRKVGSSNTFTNHTMAASGLKNHLQNTHSGHVPPAHGILIKIEKVEVVKLQ